MNRPNVITRSRPPAVSVRESVERSLVCAVADKDFARARSLVTWFEGYEADEQAGKEGN